MWCPDGHLSWHEVFSEIQEIAQEITSLVCMGGTPQVTVSGLPAHMQSATHYLLQNSLVESESEGELAIALLTAWLMSQFFYYFPPLAAGLNGGFVTLHPVLLGHREQFELTAPAFTMTSATEYNEDNERIKRHYLHYLRQAKGCDDSTVTKAADAILRFERSTNYKSFKLFHIEQAVTFKGRLEAEKNSRTSKPLSKATIDGTLRAVKAFVLWLAGQSGYKSRISYADAEYFNLNAKDARIAHAERDAPYPTMEQCRHAFGLMPSATPLERRNKALFAFLMLTGARDGAIASLRLKHIDLAQACVYQDARDVKTKFSKTFTTWFFPVDDAYLQAFRDWIAYLRQDQLFGHADALFPKPLMGLNDGGFACLGISRETYANAGKIRDVVKEAFTTAGLPAFGPHSFRKTLGILANERCRTPEQFKAWSLNLGHENIATTLSAYCPVSTTRQGELIRAMA